MYRETGKESRARCEKTAGMRDTGVPAHNLKVGLLPSRRQL